MSSINYIFIVDDDPITIFGIRKMLGATVTCNKMETFVNGKLALDAIQEILRENDALPEIIFLDINMPIVDGWQFLEVFLELPIKEKIRINVVTSSIDPVDLEQYKKYSARTHHEITYNHKPISLNKIKAITTFTSIKGKV